MGTKAPYIRRTTQGRTKYSWRRCPYAIGDISNRIPDIEKSIHYTTSGHMSLDVRGGHDLEGFVCLDPNCSFFKGTATTKITLTCYNQKVNSTTGEYTIEEIPIDVPICSGTHFWEK
jgi:hypothetical protein